MKAGDGIFSCKRFRLSDHLLMETSKRILSQERLSMADPLLFKKKMGSAVNLSFLLVKLADYPFLFFLYQPVLDGYLAGT